MLFKLISGILDICPDPMRNLLAEGMAVVLFVLSPNRRRNVRENLSRIGAPAGAGEVLNIFINHCKNMIELFASSRWTDAEIRKLFETVEIDELEKAISEGRGAIIAAVHVGNWEMAALYLNSLGYHISVVTGIQLNALLSKAVKEAKEKRGIRVLVPEGSYRNLFRSLVQNGTIALLVDGNVYSGGTEVKFFQEKLPLPRGPVRLSRRTGAPILGCYCRRLTGNRFSIHIDRLLDAEEARTLPESKSLAKLYGRVEEYVRENSDQWCIFRRFWSRMH